MKWLQKIAGLSEDALDRLQMSGNRVVEEALAGIYELFLVLFEHGPIRLYQLAIQRTGLDFTDVQQQMEPQEMPNNVMQEMQSLEEIRAIINKWKQQYGELVIKSHNPTKDDKYLNILQWLGFQPHTKSIMGNSVIVI